MCLGWIHGHNHPTSAFCAVDEVEVGIRNARSLFRPKKPKVCEDLFLVRLIPPVEVWLKFVRKHLDSQTGKSGGFEDGKVVLEKRFNLELRVIVGHEKDLNIINNAIYFHWLSIKDGWDRRPPSVGKGSHSPEE